MGNKVSDLPVNLDRQLQDFAQQYGDIDYDDIIKFSKRVNDWDKAQDLIKKLDKSGFFELDLNDEPTNSSLYNELIDLIKRKRR